MWDDLTILWNDLTIDWNDLTWNDLTMERNDRKPTACQPRSQGLSSYRLRLAPDGKMRDPGNEVDSMHVPLQLCPMWQTCPLT